MPRPIDGLRPFRKGRRHQLAHARSNIVSSPRKLVSGNPPTRCHSSLRNAIERAGARSRRPVRALFHSEERRRSQVPDGLVLGIDARAAQRIFSAAVQRWAQSAAPAIPDRKCSRHRRRRQLLTSRLRSRHFVRERSVPPKPSSCSSRREWQSGWDTSTSRCYAAAPRCHRSSRHRQ